MSAKVKIDLRFIEANLYVLRTLKYGVSWVVIFFFLAHLVFCSEPTMHSDAMQILILELSKRSCSIATLTPICKENITEQKKAYILFTYY